MAADLGPRAMFVAGGTDLFPKLKRRQFEIDTLIGLDFLPRSVHNGSGECVIDAGVTLAAAAQTRSAYVKLRRRGSIDFPIAGAAVAVVLDGDVVRESRIVLSAVASHPLEVRAAEEFLNGRRLEPEAIQGAAELAAKPAKPLDNADLSHFWRKRMVRVVVEQALGRVSDQRAGLGG